MASVLVPVLYVFLVFGGLLVFSHYYRRHIANKRFEPYFGRHLERDVYFALLQKDPPASEALLRAALVRRAVTDVTRIVRMREDKPALQNLLQKGSIGDELWNSLLAAEKELEAEILDVISEANAYVEGWGNVVFQTATEMMHNEKLRVMLESTLGMRGEAERKYGKAIPAAKAVEEAPAVPRLAATPPVHEAASPSPSAPSSPAPSTPATLASPLPETPSPAKSRNGLAPPSSNGDESGSERAPSPTPSSPRTPSTPSKSGKKGKKRK